MNHDKAEVAMWRRQVSESDLDRNIAYTPPRTEEEWKPVDFVLYLVCVGCVLMVCFSVAVERGWI